MAQEVNRVNRVNISSNKDTIILKVPATHLSRLSMDLVLVLGMFMVKTIHTGKTSKTIVLGSEQVLPPLVLALDPDQTRTINSSDNSPIQIPHPLTKATLLVLGPFMIKTIFTSKTSKPIVPELEQVLPPLVPALKPD